MTGEGLIQVGRPRQTSPAEQVDEGIALVRHVRTNSVRSGKATCTWRRSPELLTAGGDTDSPRVTNQTDPVTRVDV